MSAATRFCPMLVALALTALLPAGAAASLPAQDTLDALRTAHRSGRYDAVLDALLADGRRGSAEPGGARLLVETLLAVGRYQEALEVAAAAVERHGDGLAYAQGRALLALGRRSEAETAFARAETARGGDALQARLWRAIVEMETGRIDAAMARFDTFIDVYNRRNDLDARDLTAVATACSYLGRRDPQLFHDAVRAYDEAIAADPGDPEPRLRLGELFLDKYDSTEAAGLIAEVLASNPRHARGWLAEARRRQFDGEPQVGEALEKALETDPNLVGAHAMRGRMRLMVEDTDGAVEAAQAALAIDPGDLEALGVLAAAHRVAGDRTAHDRTVARILEVNPQGAQAFVIAAEMAVYNRLYGLAVELARRATELDPGFASGWGVLGINQLRVGAIEKGRESLERAFAGDPFNVWFKNTLDLLDTFPGYATVATEHFDLFIERERAELLSLYMGPLAEQALSSLVERYGYRPPHRIRVEVYSRHADFSVRTVGLAGLGALGVAFGPVVAVDGPAAPGMGEFNWGATLWHEIAHVVTLGATDNRIPRWLTEGLSVFEERRALPGWGDDLDPGFVLAWLQGRLHPVSRINDGFVRPSYPGHVGHSYLQASLVCELIADRYGFEALPAMLDGYRRGLDTPAVFREVLGVAVDGLDDAFIEWFEQRYGRQIEALRPALADAADPDAGGEPVRSPDSVTLETLLERAEANPTDYAAAVRAGRALVDRGDPDMAIPLLERARELFPEHAGPDSAYPALARAYEQTGSIDRAVEVLRAMTARHAGHAAAWRHLALLEERRGRDSEAAEALAQVVWIDPASIELQEKIASLAERSEDWQRAVRARSAVVALAPVDRAAALYRLAVAHEGAGDRAAARRAVLGALEIAPSYPDAQELLLRLRSAREET